MRKQYIAFTGFVLLVCLGLTTLSVCVTHKKLHEHAKEVFKAQQETVIRHLESHIQAYHSILKGAAGLLSASEFVTLDEWLTYESEIEVSKHYPGVESLGYAKIVPRSEKESFIEKMRNSGFSNFDIHPDSDLEILAPEIYFAPYREKSRAMGFDAWSEPHRREAMRVAAETGMPTVSAKLQLVADAEHNINNPSFLMAFPHYKSSEDKTAVGFVFGLFRVNAMMAEFMTDIPDIRLEIYDGEQIKADNLLFDSHPLTNEEDKRFFSTSITASHIFSIDNRIWTLRFTALPNFSQNEHHNDLLNVFILGLVISLLTTGLVWTVITTRHRAEKMADSMTKVLRESEERYEIATMGSAAGLWDCNLLNGHLDWAGPAAAIFDAPSNDRLPDSIEEYKSFVHPDDLPGFEAARERNTKHNKVYTFEYRLKTFSNRIKWVSVRGQSFWKDGKAVRLAGSILDITEQKAAEEKLIFSHKMDAVGKLTGGIAHDFNNLLQVILTNVDLIEGQYNKDEKLHRKIKLINEAAEKGTSLTRRMLAFATEQKLSKEHMDINGIITGMKELIQQATGESIKIELHLEDPLPHVYLDKVQLETSIINLVVNARDAMPKGGKVTIKTTYQYIDQYFISPDSTEELVEGDYIVLSVADNGTGIDKENLGKIFDPFFTTKGPDEGTGLGLSMVYGFVKQSGGMIRVYSEPGYGTSFKLFFPTIKGEDGIKEKIDLKHNLHLERSPARILIVEDDPLVRETVDDHLSSIGYTVTSVSNADEALHALESERFDLLFSDVVLPGEMSGPELVATVRNKFPNTAVLLTSGYEKQVMSPELAALVSDIRLINKPYRIQSLVNHIETILRGPHESTPG